MVGNISSMPNFLCQNKKNRKNRKAQQSILDI